MSQSVVNETYSAINIDPNGVHAQFGSFEIKTLNKLRVNHESLPGITDPQLPSTSVPGYNKMVGEVDSFNTRIEQTETDINLLATDVQGNTSQINVNASGITQLVTDVNNNSAQISIQAGQITSLVSDVDGNTSSITQQAGQIASLVTDVNGNTSSITQNSNQISSLVTDVNGNSSQITQQAGQISTLISDVNGNTSSISQQAGQITTLINDVNGNTSSITQNSTDIALAVSDINSNYSQIQQNATQINLKVAKNDVINQINISNEGIKIQADNIQISGATTFSSGYDPSTKETPAGAQAKVNTLENSLGDLATEDDVSLAMLDSTIIQGGYIKTTLIQTQDLDVSGTFTAGTSSDYVKIHRPTSGTYANVPVIEFVDDAGGDLGGVIYYDDDVLVDQLVVRAQGMTLQSKLVLDAGNQVTITLDTWNDHVSFNSNIDMNGNDINDLDNLYVDDIYTGDLYAQNSFIYVKDPMIFSGSTTTLTIPGGSSTSPEFNGTGSIYYNSITKKIGIYDGGWIWTDALT